MMPSGGALRVDAGSICCLSGSRALSPCSRSNTPTWAFRTFHALYLPGHRTDPRPAAAGSLACGAAAGGVVADAAAIAVWQSSRRSCDGTGLWSGISGGNRSRPAAGVLARRYRVPRRRQSYVRRLSAGAALRRRNVLDLVSPGTRGCRRTTGGAGGLADDDSHGVRFAWCGVWPPGAGASALGAAAAAFLATDRAGAPQRVVRMVDRSRTLAADDLSRARPVDFGRRICGRNLARTAHADIVRSAVRAAGDCRAGAALSDLADPRRYAGAAAMAGDRGPERPGAALGRTARRLAAGNFRHRGAGGDQLGLVWP